MERGGGRKFRQAKGFAQVILASLPPDDYAIRIVGWNFSIGLASAQQQAIAQRVGAAHSHAAVHRAILPGVLQLQDRIGLDAAAPVVILIIELRDRAEPVDKTIEQVYPVIDEDAAAGLRPRKVEARRALPVKDSPLRPVITQQIAQRALLQNDRQQAM